MEGHRSTGRAEAPGDVGPPREKMVVLAGNVAVGKSVIFDQLTATAGRDEVTVPGTRLSVPTGRFKSGPLSRDCMVLADPPGIYSLFSHDEDANIIHELLLEGRLDGVVQVLDAKNLRRSLTLAFEIAELELPTCFALNMVDMARGHGIEVSVSDLRNELDAVVAPTVALEHRGLAEIPRLLLEAKPPRRHTELPRPVEACLAQLERLLRGVDAPVRPLALLLLAGAGAARRYVTCRLGKGMLDQVDRLVAELTEELRRPVDVVLTECYATTAERVTARVHRVSKLPPPFVTRFGHWAQRLPTGIPIAMVVLAGLYLFVGELGATMLVDLLNAKLFGELLTPLFTAGVSWIPSAFVRDALVDPSFGVLTTGLFLAFGIVMPVMLCFYFAFGLLEESGYLPRFSLLLHRALRRIGLNGKGMIPLVMGFSCITMALLTTRMLDSRKERIIASFLLMLGMPCAPLIATMLVILDAMPWYATLFLILFLLVQTIIAGLIANRVLPGGGAELMLELPPMRLPNVRSVTVSTWRRTYSFMREATPLFLLAAFVVFVFDRAGGLDLMARVSRPLIDGVLGLPDASVRVFLKAVIRRESGAVELDLLRGGFDNLQLMVSLVTLTFAVPCVNAVAVLFKERRFNTALIILASTFIYALLAGGLVNHGCKLLGITFS